MIKADEISDMCSTLNISRSTLYRYLSLVSSPY
ncbi:TPA: helix-turn-helix domain-containing protein [Legionella pneumophila]